MLAAPTYRTILNKRNAINADIITALERNYKTAVAQCREFAKTLQGATNEDTAHNIFNFILKNISYVRDNNETQNIKLPSRFISDGTGDCKSYSLFTAGCLGALNMPVKFIYASYTKNDATPTHVYVETKSDTGEPIIIDAVYGFFNAEKNTEHKIKHAMNVQTLAGIGDLYIQKLQAITANKPGTICANLAARELTRLQGGNVEPLSEIKRANYAKTLAKYYKNGNSICGQLLKKEVQGINGIGAGGRGKKKLQLFSRATKKLVLSPGRNAYLALIDLNVHKLATNLARVDEKLLRKKWEKLGGNFDKLKNAINRGKSKKSILGIGVVETATLLAAAAPVIIAMAVLIKSLKKSKPGDEADFAQTLSLAQDATKAAFANETYGKGNLPDAEDKETVIVDKGKGEDHSMFDLSPKVLLMVAGGFVAAKILKVF
jgi:hypothetical protein